MKLKHYIYTITLFLLSFSWGQAQTLSDIETGRVRIKFTKTFANEHIPSMGVNAVGATGTSTTAGWNAPDLQSVNQKYNITVFKRVFPFSAKHEAKHRKHNLHLWYEVQFNGLQDPREVVSAYAQVTGVEIAKPIYKKVSGGLNVMPVYVEANILKAEAVNADDFNDPLLKDQWHYENDGTLGVKDADIDLFDAWEVNTGNPKVIVGIIDGGIDTQHEDITDNLWVNEAELNGEDGVDDDGNGYIDDIHGYNFKSNGQVTATLHGTHVAGTVGAVSNNGVGVAGVAGGDGSDESGVSMISCQIFENEGSSGGAAQAYIYAADNGAVIAQSSWGYTSPGYYEQDVQDAINYFIDEAGDKEVFPETSMEGGLVIFAAGNSGEDHLHYPAAFDNVLAVTSTGPDGQPSSFTNYGTWADIAAPGGDQRRYGEEGGVLSTFPNNQYGYINGTSMSCPHVSGVAALILSEYLEENLTPDELRSRILDGVLPFPSDMNSIYDGKMGLGVLNARMAMQSDNLISPDSISDFRAENIYHNAIELAWTVPVDEDDESPAVYYLWVNSEEINEDFTDAVAPFVIPSALEAGEEALLMFNGLRKQTEYYFALQAADRWGNKNGIVYTDAMTLDEPMFSFSPKNVTVEVDVTKQKVVEQTVTIKNQGEAALLWSSSVENRVYVAPDTVATGDEEEEEETTSMMANLFSKGPKVEMLSANKAFIDFAGVFDVDRKIGFASAPNEIGTFGAMSAADVKEIATDTLIDQTEYIAGIQHEGTNYFDYVLYELNSNIGFVSATRFEIPLDYRFPITHIEALIAIDSNGTEEPFIVEILKGGNEPHDLETIYAQPYYPREETFGTWAWHTMSLARPIEAKGDEVYWVKIHHPKRANTFLAAELTSSFPGANFWTSHDGGRTFQYSSYELTFGGYLIPKVRMFSSGEDPAYVYIDPITGEVEGGSEDDIRLVIDATNLSEGKHSAAAAIYTNDNNFPVGAVMVEVDVKGQQAEATYDYTQDMGTLYSSVANKVEIEIENTGLDTLEIYDFVSAQPAFSYENKEDTILILPNRKRVMQVNIEPTSTGVFAGEGQMKTNIGDLAVIFNGLVIEPPVASFTPAVVVESTDTKTTKEISFTVTNTGNTPMEVEIPMDFMGKNKHTGYVLDNTNAGEFEDISAFGTPLRDSVLNAYGIEREIGFDFPYFDNVSSHVGIHARGFLYFIDYRFPLDASYWGDVVEYPFSKTNRGSLSLIETSRITLVDDRLWQLPSEANLYCANLGDRFIVQYHNVKGNLKDEEEGRITVQVALFKNGAIEFRYKDIQENSIADNALIGFQNLDGTVGYTIQKWDTTAVTEVASGEVYRFERAYGQPFVTNVSESNFILQPNQSKVITATVDPTISELFDGKHTDFIHLKTNTNKGYEQLRVELDVAGNSNMVLDTAEVNFDELVIGESAKQGFFVENTDTKAFMVTELYSGESAFTTNVEVPFMVSPKERKYIELTYTPTEAQEVEETWYIKSDIPDQESITITASAVVSPVPSIVISEVNFDLNTGETAEGTLTVENTTSTPLHYSIYPSSFTRFDIDEAEVNTYTSRDSHIDTQVRCEWVDIVDSKNKIVVPTNGFKGFELPFDFEFYGEKTDSIWVNENGYLTGITPSVTTDPRYGPATAAIYEVDRVYGAIVPMWGMWTKSESDSLSGIYMTMEEDRVIVLFNALRNDNMGMPGDVTFEAILYKNGQIKFQYERVDNFNGEFWHGLTHPKEERTEVDLGRTGYELPDFFKTDFKDFQAIILTPAVEYTLDGNSSVEYNFTVDPERLGGGTYLDTIRIETNSTEVSALEEEVSLTVTGYEKLVAGQDTVSMPYNHYYADNPQVYTKVFSIYNYGTEKSVIEEIQMPNLPDAGIFREGNELYFRSNSDKLVQKIEMEVGDTLALELAYEANELGEYTDSILFKTEGEILKVPVWASTVVPPSMNVIGADVDTVINVADSVGYMVVVENTGETPLSFSAFVNYNEDTFGDDGEGAGGADSLNYDSPYNSSLYFGNATNTLFRTGTRFTAPEAGFILTHVKTMVRYIEQGMVRVQIYDGSKPTPYGAKLIYEEDIMSNSTLGTPSWMELELSEQVEIPANDDFIVVISHTAFGKAVYEETDDKEILSRMLAAVNPGNTEEYTWFTGDSTVSAYGEELRNLWKIRLLSSGGNWLEIDTEAGTIEAGESQEIVVNTINENLESGTNRAQVVVRSNDLTNNEVKINYTFEVNTAPEFIYTPNQYGEYLTVEEGERLVANLLAQDPEGDVLTWSIADDSTFASVTKVTDYQAQLVLKPDFDDQGEQVVNVSVKDEFGNETIQPINVRVLNVNQAPVVVAPWSVGMLLEQPIGYTINMSEIIEDPDGDELQYGAFNDTPNIVEVTYSSEEVVIIPRNVGTGIVYLYGDDGSENGFSYTYVLINVFSDGSSTATSGTTSMSVYPNPMVDEVTLSFETESKGQAHVEIINMDGAVVRAYDSNLAESGTQQVHYNVEGLKAGVYMIRVVTNSEVIGVKRIIVQ